MLIHQHGPAQAQTCFGDHFSHRITALLVPGVGARLEIERQVPDNLVDFGIARFGVLDNVAESLPVDDHGETAGVIVQPPERDTAPDVGALLKQLAQRRIQINRAIFYERGEGESGQGLGGGKQSASGVLGCGAVLKTPEAFRQDDMIALDHADREPGNLIRPPHGLDLGPQGVRQFRLR